MVLNTLILLLGHLCSYPSFARTQQDAEAAAHDPSYSSGLLSIAPSSIPEGTLFALAPDYYGTIETEI